MNNEVVYPKFRFLVGIAATMAWINMGWVVIGFAPLLPLISREFNVPIGTVAIGVFALKSFVAFVGIVLIGPLVDRYGPRIVLFVSAILCVVYALLIPVTHTYTQIVVLRLFMGLVCMGPLFAGKAAMAQRWFPRKEQSTWIGIWNAGVPIGVVVMYLFYYPLLKHFNGEWRDVGAFAAVPSAILFVLMLISLFGKEPPVVRYGPSELTKRDFSIALKLPVLWAGAILLGCAQGLLENVNSFAASYLMAPTPLGLGWKPFIAGPTMTFVQWGMIIGGFLVSTMLVFIFRGSIKWFAACGFLLVGLASYFLTSSFSKASPSHMKISFFIVGYLLVFGYPAVTTFVTQNYPPHILGKVFGLCGGISILLNAVFVMLGGAILNWTHTFKALYGYSLIMGVFAFILTAIMLNPIKVFAKREAPVAPEAVGTK